MSNMTVLWICAAPLAESCSIQTISRQNKDTYAYLVDKEDAQDKAEEAQRRENLPK